MNWDLHIVIIFWLVFTNFMGFIAWFLRYREVQFLMKQKTLGLHPAAMITTPLPQEARPRGKSPDIFEDVDPEEVPDTMKEMMKPIRVGSHDPTKGSDEDVM